MGLELRVRNLEQIVAALQRELAELRIQDTSSEDSFAVVSHPEALQAPVLRAAASSPAHTGPVTHSGYPKSPPGAATATDPSLSSPCASSGHQSPAQARAAACCEIGLFLCRCLAGVHGGASGRVGIAQASRYWIVARDYHNRDLQLVVVATRFSEVARLCKQGTECSDSVFVGAPSRGDVIAVAAAADLLLPAGW